MNSFKRNPHIYQEVGGKKVEVKGRYVIKKEGNRYLFSFHVPQYNPKYALVIDPVLSYSTYLGGSGNDYGIGIAVDSTGSAYVTGYTYSTNFPTQNAYQGDQGGADVFITKLSPQGNSLIYSTYLGGSDVDVGSGIAVDSSGAAYVTGYTYST
ncbi:MAG: SBBP repeat-containing protein, partial [Aquificaceae bacterium]